MDGISCNGTHPGQQMASVTTAITSVAVSVNIVVCNGYRLTSLSFFCCRQCLLIYKQKFHAIAQAAFYYCTASRLKLLTPTRPLDRKLQESIDDGNVCRWTASNLLMTVVAVDRLCETAIDDGNDRRWMAHQIHWLRHDDRYIHNNECTAVNGVLWWPVILI